MKVAKRVCSVLVYGMLGMALFSLSGCSESPYDSLASKKLSDEYDYNFWQNEAREKSPLWEEAKAFCKNRHPLTKNCATVNQVQFFAFDTDIDTTYQDKGMGKISFDQKK